MGDSRTKGPEELLPQLVGEAIEVHDRVEREVQELESTIEETGTETEKLSRRNAQIAQRVRQMESDLEAYSRQEIKEAYSAAQESQMRLFTMKGQLEQLEGKKEVLKNLAEQLGHLRQTSEGIQAGLQPKEMGSSIFGDSPIAGIIEAQEVEKQRLARQMHDGPAQALTNLILLAEICERLFDTDPKQARIELQNLKKAVNVTFQKTRRFIFNLRPMMLDDLGLIPTLKRYIQDYKTEEGPTVDLRIVGEERRLLPPVEVTLFRSVQELLNNAQQHSQASHVQINVDLEGENMSITVEDDGSGFDVEETLASAKEKKTLGLVTIKERVEMLGGKFNIESKMGGGTKARIEMSAR